MNNWYLCSKYLKKSFTVNDKTMEVDGLDKNSKNLGKSSVTAGKKLATKVMENPGRILENRTKIGGATVFRNHKGYK